MTFYDMKFDLKPYGELDKFALLACHKNNFGNETAWFGSFRGGLNGFYNRLHGASSLCEEMYAWNSKSSFADLDSFAASILFNLDSAIECLTFAMNALGFAACPGQFHDITDAKALKKIYPINIWDELPSKENSAINEAYESIFPDLQNIGGLNRIFLTEYLSCTMFQSIARVSILARMQELRL